MIEVVVTSGDSPAPSKRRIRRSGVRFAVLLAVASIASGCGTADTGRLPLHGEVTYDGKAIEDGTIIFLPTSSGQAQANGTISNGRFSLAAEYGLPRGTYKVRIEAFRAAKSDGAAPANALYQSVGDGSESFLPAKYNEQSTLTIAIESDNSGALDFHLER